MINRLKVKQGSRLNIIKNSIKNFANTNKTYKVVFIRHGQSTWNLENRFTGWTDVDLTPLGKLSLLNKLKFK